MNREAEDVLYFRTAVGVPAITLVEPPGPRILLEYPQNGFAETVLAQAIQDGPTVLIARMVPLPSSATYVRDAPG